MAETKDGQNAETARQQEAERSLQDLQRRQPTFAGSSLADAAHRAADHFGGKDAVGAGERGATDPIELWGRRIGRLLSLVVVVVLAVHLFMTYVLR